MRELLELAEKATPGPWEVANTERIFIFRLGYRGEDDFVADTGPEDEAQTVENAELIVAAVNVVVPLATDWLRLREELEFAARNANHLPREGRNAEGDAILTGGCIPGCPGCRTEAALGGDGEGSLANAGAAEEAESGTGSPDVSV